MKTYLLLGWAFIFLWGCGAKSREKSTENHIANAKGLTQNISAGEYEKYHALVANFFDSTLLRGKFSGSILVAKGGAIVYEEYLGYKDITTKDTLTAETSLQIASTSKPFTAAAIQRLVQEGRLNINSPLSEFFPGFPYENVTVKMLLNHRSGLPNYLYYMDIGGWQRQTLATNEDVLNTLINWRPQPAYKPDSHFNYCNTNFVLLALIVEKVTGLSFPQYMKQTFFEPLQMANTYVTASSDSVRSAGSYDGYGKLWPLDFSDGPYGDKNVYSTPRDLLKWDQALYDGAVLSQQSLDSAFTPYSNEKPSVHNYGLGWRLLMIPNGKKVIYHNGRWHGFNSAFSRLTDEKVTIIILSNKFNRNVYTVARNMYNLFGNYDNRQGDGLE